jgi:hypothetical protein
VPPGDVGVSVNVPVMELLLVMEVTSATMVLLDAIIFG